MCVVSMVMDMGRTSWPWNPPVGSPIQPVTVPFNTTDWTIATTDEATALQAFEELIAAAEKLDRILGLADCEDPEKAKWLDAVRERVRQHEASKVDRRLDLTKKSKNV